MEMGVIEIEDIGLNQKSQANLLRCLERGGLKVEGKIIRPVEQDVYLVMDYERGTRVVARDIGITINRLKVTGGISIYTED